MLGLWSRALHISFRQYVIVCVRRGGLSLSEEKVYRGA